jgi:tellurite resistance protein
MGLKDLFGGGKKKEELREKAKEVVSKGKLTPGKAEELKALAQEHEGDLADDKTRMRRSIYNKAVGVAKARGKLSEGEAAELAKIQKFLALRDDQVEQT